MSEDGWAARWGLMLMGELKLSTQTLRGQNCRSVFLMLTSPQHQGCKSASSMEGSGGGGKKKDRISSSFSCPLPILLFSPIPLPFPVKFPTSSFSSEIETMIAPYGGAGERISSFPSSALGRNGLLGLRGRLSALPLCSLASVRQEAGVGFQEHQDFGGVSMGKVKSPPTEDQQSGFSEPLITLPLHHTSCLLRRQSKTN